MASKSRTFTHDAMLILIGGFVGFVSSISTSVIDVWHQNKLEQNEISQLKREQALIMIESFEDDFFQYWRSFSDFLKYIYVDQDHPDSARAQLRFNSSIEALALRTSRYTATVDYYFGEDHLEAYTDLIKLSFAGAKLHELFKNGSMPEEAFSNYSEALSLAYSRFVVGCRNHVFSNFETKSALSDSIRFGGLPEDLQGKLELE